jgi:hypothetical protein
MRVWDSQGGRADVELNHNFAVYEAWDEAYEVSYLGDDQDLSMTLVGTSQSLCVLKRWMARFNSRSDQRCRVEPSYHGPSSSSSRTSRISGTSLGWDGGDLTAPSVLQ